jgi:hypothetical protein
LVPNSALLLVGVSPDLSPDSAARSSARICAVFHSIHVILQMPAQIKEHLPGMSNKRLYARFLEFLMALNFSTGKYIFSVKAILPVSSPLSVLKGRGK